MTSRTRTRAAADLAALAPGVGFSPQNAVNQTSTFVVRSPDNTPASDLDNPIITSATCQPKQFAPWASPSGRSWYSYLDVNDGWRDNNGVPSPTNNRGNRQTVQNGQYVSLPEADAFHNEYRTWVNVCTLDAATVNSLLAGGGNDFIVQVLSNVPYQAGGVLADPLPRGSVKQGRNHFALRATSGTTDIDTFANGRLPIAAAARGANTTFYLAKVGPEQAGRTLSVEFFDVGDTVATGTITINKGVGSGGSGFTCSFTRIDMNNNNKPADLLGLPAPERQPGYRLPGQQDHRAGGHPRRLHVQPGRPELLVDDPLRLPRGRRRGARPHRVVHGHRRRPGPPRRVDDSFSPTSGRLHLLSGYSPGRRVPIAERVDNCEASPTATVRGAPVGRTDLPAGVPRWPVDPTVGSPALRQGGKGEGQTVMRSRAGRTRRRARGEQGATLVEAAIILPVLFILVFGVMEVGRRPQVELGAANAVRAGARMASVAGNDASPTSRSWPGWPRSRPAFGNGEIEYIVIWHASGPGDSRADACIAVRRRPRSTPSPRSASATGAPTPSARATSTTARRRPAARSTWPPAGRPSPRPTTSAAPARRTRGGRTRSTASWPAKNRKARSRPAAPLPADADPDYLGVYIQAQHEYVTGILGDDAHHHRLGIPCSSRRVRGELADAPLLRRRLGRRRSRRHAPRVRHRRARSCILLAFGTAEIGLAWVANNRVEGPRSTAARVGVQQRDEHERRSQRSL